MFARSSGDLPTVIGAEAPLENVNSDRQFGIDLELTHRNKIGDFSYKVKAIGTITRRKHMTAVDKGPWSSSYDRWRNDNLNNRYQGVQFGYNSQDVTLIGMTSGHTLFIKTEIYSLEITSM